MTGNAVRACRCGSYLALHRNPYADSDMRDWCDGRAPGVVSRTDRQPRVPPRSFSFGEALGLPVVQIAYPLPAGLSRWADPRVAGNMALTQGEHVRPILVDPCA